MQGRRKLVIATKAGMSFYLAMAMPQYNFMILLEEANLNSQMPWMPAY